MKGHFRDFFRLKVRFTGILSAVVTICCIGTVTSLLAGNCGLFELTSHFPVQYFLALMFAAFVFGWLRIFFWATVALLFAIPNLVVLLPFYSANREYSDVQPLVRIVLMNVHRENMEYETATEFVRTCNPDILVAEEISEMWVQHLRQNLPALPYTLTRHRDDEFGVGLFSKRPLEVAQILEAGTMGYPAIKAVVVVGTKRLTIFAIHPPPPIMELFREERIRQVRTVANLARQEEGVVVLGDLNMTPWSPIFQDLLSTASLRDGRKGFGIQPTWPSTFPWLLIPIDHCLASKDLIIKSFSTGPNIGSDHYPLVVDLGMVPAIPQQEKRALFNELRN